jgi:large subunit ribosomal protein L2
MNPVDHPHGGGEARRPAGATGVAVGIADKGYKTRNRKSTDKFIVQRRRRAPGRL